MKDAEMKVVWFGGDVIATSGLKCTSASHGTESNSHSYLKSYDSVTHWVVEDVYTKDASGNLEFSETLEYAAEYGEYDNVTPTINTWYYWDETNLTYHNTDCVHQ